MDWWKYMKHVHSICYESITEECSQSGHKEIGQNYSRTEECVRYTFEGKRNIDTDDNRVLREF